MVWVVAVVVVVVVVDSFSVLFTTGHSRGFVSFRFVFLVCSLSASFCEHQTRTTSAARTTSALSLRTHSC